MRFNIKNYDTEQKLVDKFTNCYNEYLKYINPYMYMGDLHICDSPDFKYNYFSYYLSLYLSNPKYSIINRLIEDLSVPTLKKHNNLIKKLILMLKLFKHCESLLYRIKMKGINLKNTDLSKLDIKYLYNIINWIYKINSSRLYKYYNKKG